MSELRDAVAEESADRLALQRRLEQARRDVRDAEARAAIAERNSERFERELGLLTHLTEATGEPPKWLTAPKKAGKHSGTLWLALSDLHLDEVVNPAEVMGVNAYSRKIAEQRLQRTFTNATKVARDYWTGLNYDGVVLPLMGDLFSGDIHEELTQTNEDTMLGSVIHWADHIAAGISLLAEEFGKVHVPVVVGNHGRRTRKPRSKMRARDNFDWFMGQLLARQFKNVKGVTFDVSESADLILPSYDKKVCITHGDQANGGNGIGGPLMPIMRLDAKKRQRQSAVDQPYDLLIMGHWHSLIFGPQFIVNGSLKGYDEYAYTSNFGFEEPAQALWLMTPEHGRTWTAPIRSMDRRLEKW